MRTEERDGRKVLNQSRDGQESELILLTFDWCESRLIIAPQRDMKVRRASRVIGERLWHEGRDLAVLAGDFLGGVFQPCAVVRGSQCVGEYEIGLDLPGPVLGLHPFQPSKSAEGLLQVGDERIQTVGVLQRIGVDVVLNR